MVIIATVKMKGRSGKHKEIVQTINGIADRVRQRKGCLGVSSYQDINDENSFYHVEQWHTRQDLYNHFDSKLFSVLLGIKSILEEPLEIEILHKKTTALDNKRSGFFVHGQVDRNKWG